MEKTITFDEEINGWTSFHSFLPDWMISLNNRFYTIKDGQLYRHNETAVGRNTFYGVSYPSKVSVMMNDHPSEVKVFKSFFQEGTQPWDTTLTSYESDSDEFKRSNIGASEFKEKEGFWYGYIRRNELSGDTTSRATYGIGVPTDITGNNVTYAQLPSSITVGDSVYKEDQTLIGNITAINGNVLTLSSVAGLTGSDFTYGQKDTRIEGAQIRGYVMRVDLENDSTSKRELYAVNSEVFKSSR